MNKNEYVEQMKDLGYSDEIIEEQIQIHDEAEKEGIKIPWELDLIDKPVD